MKNNFFTMNTSLNKTFRINIPRFFPAPVELSAEEADLSNWKLSSSSSKPNFLFRAWKSAE